MRVLVLTGSGGHFSSGAIVSSDLYGASASDNAALMRRMSRAAVALHDLEKPTVAAVDGVVMGAAMNLAIGCDVVLCTPRARFSELFVKRGLALDLGGSWLLPRVVGPVVARDLALTGREVGGTEAVAMGLASRLVDPIELADEAAKVAASLAEGPPLAQTMIKRLLDRGSSMTFEQAIRFENMAQAVLLGSEDLNEGVDAFVEKRQARFRGL